MDHDVGAPVEGPAEVGRGHGVVDDERDARLARHRRQGFQIADHAARIGQALDEDRLGPGRQRTAHGRRVVDVDEVSLPVEFLEGLAELGDRAAVEPGRGDETVARFHQGEESENLGGVAGSAAGAAAPAFQIRQAFFEGGHRRIRESRVDEAEGLQVEQRGRVVGVVEHVGGVLEDRRLARAGDRLRLGAGVDHAGFEAVLAARLFGSVFCHDRRTLRRLAEMMRELNPPQDSSALRRPNSIFGQRSMTTVRPASRALSAAASLMTPSCIQIT